MTKRTAEKARGKQERADYRTAATVETASRALALLTVGQHLRFVGGWATIGNEQVPLAGFTGTVESVDLSGGLLADDRECCSVVVQNHARVQATHGGVEVRFDAALPALASWDNVLHCSVDPDHGGLTLADYLRFALPIAALAKEETP